MKIAISTISKNEAHNVKDFVKSCKEADLISVLDTGSTDKTVELLKKHKAFAGQAKIEPFRFDEARNKTLNLLPKNIDIIVALDLDERLSPGWRKALEGIWQSRPETEAVNCLYVAGWQDEKQTVPAVIPWCSKIFKRKGFKWFNPIHEIPGPKNKRQAKTVFSRQLTIYHYHQKRIKKEYIDLLTKLVEKEPENQRGYLQRASDYFHLGKYQQALKDFEQYLELSRHEQKQCLNSEYQDYKTTAERRANVNIWIGKTKHQLGRPPMEIIRHFLAAAAEAPDMREAWTYLADGWMAVGNYPSAYGAAMTALNITDPGTYGQELICWGDFPKQIADRAYAKITSQ